ncbi:hypothetical protein CEXT_764891 [Caerostris extrusa]|uniref:Uncharacterized protein n=1 Tax=Caerostris extrusa TaxID=172846 RepID=A0AAV4XK37_CAEEX|nr:hypothetical protein CEXT_764891 [Caerostris extrusa]
MEDQLSVNNTGLNTSASLVTERETVQSGVKMTLIIMCYLKLITMKKILILMILLKETGKPGAMEVLQATIKKVKVKPMDSC